MTDAIDLEALERLRAEATPGPWRSAGGYLTVRNPDGDSFTRSIFHLDEMGQLTHQGPFQAVPFARREDASLIVAAVNALPSLIAAARERDALLAERAGAPDAGLREKVAAVLAYQRRIDTLDDERFGDDGMTRESYWRSITDRERELMRLRAESILALLPPAASHKTARGDALEEAAKVADNWTDADHIAHDIRQSHFPRRSPVQDAIASAIRALKDTQ